MFVCVHSIKRAESNVEIIKKNDQLDTDIPTYTVHMLHYRTNVHYLNKHSTRWLIVRYIELKRCTHVAVNKLVNIDEHMSGTLHVVVTKFHFSTLANRLVSKRIWRVRF